MTKAEIAFLWYNREDTGNHKSIQEGTAHPTTGKQHLQLTIHQTGNKMDARHMWIPRLNHMEQSSQSRKFFWMATTDRKEYLQILPRDG